MIGADEFFIDPEITSIEAPVDANVWKVEVAEGDTLEPNQVVCLQPASFFTVTLITSVGQLH